MSTAVGITVPKMLPITGTFALPFTAYFIFLSGRVVKQRLNDEHFIGNDSSKTPEQKKYNPLVIATRCHENFAENVPLAFLLAAVAELNGANRKVLTGALGALLTLRVLHAEFGLRGPDAMSAGRPIGYFGTLGVLGGLAGYAAFLVKGYWGF